MTQVAEKQAVAVGAAQVDTARPRLILLPGMVCNHRAWVAQQAALADIADIQVACYGDATSVTAMAERVLDSFSGACLVAGHSMGGRVAMEMQRLAGDRVRGLCLIGTEYRARPAGEDGERESAGRRALLDIATRQGMRTMAWHWLPGIVFAPRISDPRLSAELVDMIGEHTPAQLLACIQAGETRPDATAQLRKIRVPTLIIGGVDDALRTPRVHLEMSSLIPGSKLRVLKRCGHMVMMEQPEAVNAAMREWIGRCVAEAAADGQ